VRRLAVWFSDLPGIIRWASAATAGALVLVAIGAAGWSWLERRETTAERLLSPIAQEVSQALARAERPSLDSSGERLRQFLRDHGRSRVAAEAWYLTGNVEFQRKDLDAAARAYSEAARRGPASIAGLSRLGLGYVREAKGDLAGALEAVNQALQGRATKDFLYPDLLLAKGRIQVQLKDTAGAVETYRRFLRDLASSARADEVRGRLALLGAGA
jgi:tetratricopeptide (TPR) repeat protein